MTDEPMLVELDTRNRISLTKLARHRRYLATATPDGSILLVPVRIVPEREATHLDDDAVVEESFVDDGDWEPSQGILRTTEVSP